VFQVIWIALSFGPA